MTNIVCIHAAFITCSTSLALVLMLGSLIQLSVACSTASDRSQEGPGNEADDRVKRPGHGARQLPLLA